MRVLFTSVPLAGHFLPLVPLAWAFRAAGHDVLVASTEELLPAALRSGLPAVACVPAGRFHEHLAEVVTSEPGRQRSAHGRAFGALAAGGREGMGDLLRRWRPDLVVSERAEFAGALAAAERGVPSVRYHWSVSDEYELNRAAAEVLGGDLTNLPDPLGVLDPWPIGLRLPQARQHLGIRHVPHHGDTAIPSWSFERGERPRICLTFGTVLPRFGGDSACRLIVALLESLSRLDVELVVAADDELVATWPPLPVTYAGRMPLGAVLPTCAVAIHHGGQGTTLTAMLAGCPQLVLPQVDDQFDNARAVAGSGAGLALAPDEATPDLVVKACGELLLIAGYRTAAVSLAASAAALPAPAEVVTLLAEGRTDRR
ncbi:nucleotide disphospho-sugar-binding domain-containing protein [Nonomuraea sp. NPDC003804]|uniref:nucleotide disphospho-sugar-binding domain-containing protein n=1 Tax=Nonomuraea sp. NPDC003804 TaxID=3154547 RepID=UPI0033A19F13